MRLRTRFFLGAMKKITIGIVEDHELLRDGLVLLLGEVNHFEISVIAKNGNEFLDEINLKENIPEVILMDIFLPGMDGFECTALLRDKYPQCRVIFLTSFEEDYLIERAYEHRANGFISKSIDANVLIKAIEEVNDSGFYFNEFYQKEKLLSVQFAQQLSPRDLKTKLTARELELIKLIYQEKSETEISRIMGISIHTVRSHRKNVMEKIGVNRTVGIVKYAIQNNLV
ncbi:MAG: response regulator transcription factor [Bacteroidetes bacterium]|nr:MAG: response regulator transcription factor [Bacteroidota bacterium]